ncbi:O-Antigen ligase [compost metagenome]
MNIPKIHQINYYDILFCLLIFIIPFSIAIPNIVLIILTLIFFKDIKKVDFKFLKNPSLQILLFLFLYLIIKALFYGTFFIDSKIYGRFLLIIGLIILLLKFKNLILLKLSFILSIFLATGVSIFNIGLYYIKYNNFPLANGQKVNELLLFERPYFGFLLTVAFLLCIDIMKIYPKYKKILIAISVSLIIFIIAISARLSFVSIALIFVIFILFYSKVNRLKKTIFLIGLFSIITLSFLSNKNLSERFNIKNGINATVQSLKNSEPRVIIWNCAFKMTQNDFNIFIGKKSYTEIKQFFHDCYGDSIKNDFQKRAFFQTRNYNSHNSFIEFYLIGGIIGLLVFLSFFVYLIYNYRISFPDFGIILALFLFCFVENIMQRQVGCYMFSIITFILLNNKLQFQNKLKISKKGLTP